MLTDDARRNLVEVEGARLAREVRDSLLADLPERRRLIGVGFAQQEAELLRRRKTLKAAVEAGSAQANMEFVAVKDRLSALTAEREAKLTEIDVAPETVAVGDVRFVAHALVIPSLDADDKAQYEEAIETTAMRFAMIYERSLGAKVSDVSKPALAIHAGLGAAPLGFDLLSTRFASGLAEEVRCIEVKGRAEAGSIYLTDNEWAKAANLRSRYWLYVVTGCATGDPRLVRVRDPFARLTGASKGGLTINLGQILAAAEPD